MTQVSVFEDLKLVASQLAGFLVLESSGARIDPSLLTSAESVYLAALDNLKSARTPERHLLAAASKLGPAIGQMRNRRDALPLLESAMSDLRAASRAIPGAQIVTFEKGCCAS